MSRARQLLPGIAYAIGLLWLNLYLCQELFRNVTAPMASMHGFWIGLARLGGNSWWHANWWPYWDCGMPFEFTYAPLFPAMTALYSAVVHVPLPLAFNGVSGLVYALGPVTLFLMAWGLTKRSGWSFIAAATYSLFVPMEMLLPDRGFSRTNIVDPRRLYLLGIWDDAPHLSALVLLPLVILFLSLALRKRKTPYYLVTIALIALSATASTFGPVIITLAAFCLLSALPRDQFWRNLWTTVGIGLAAYAISSPWLSPSLMRAIPRASSSRQSDQWTVESFTALALIAVGWVLLRRYLPRWTRNWQLQFFTLFAFLMAAIPFIAVDLHRQFVPQPSRYKLEMELAMALLLTFSLRTWIDRMSVPLRAALLFLFLALCGEQIVHIRLQAKDWFHPAGFAATIEYRAATWAAQNLAGQRVMMPGSMAQWTDAFADVPQFSGESWTMAPYPVQQRGVAAIFNGADDPAQDARVSLAWLKAFGVSAITMAGPQSPEFWKPYSHPAKFEGLLPVLWREQDTTIYEVPARSRSLAHVVPSAALVNKAPKARGETGEIDRYVAAIDDPSLPDASFRWDGNNRAEIAATLRPGQAISVQVSYHPGWHATANGKRTTVRPDGLGLISLRPDCDGPCDIVLTYNGGWELSICRAISFIGILLLLGWLPMKWLLRRRAGKLRPL